MQAKFRSNSVEVAMYAITYHISFLFFNRTQYMQSLDSITWQYKRFLSKYDNVKSIKRTIRFINQWINTSLTLNRIKLSNLTSKILLITLLTSDLNLHLNESPSRVFRQV